MKKSRHFTTLDDWVTLNPEITNTEFRVYAILKGKVKHGYGGVPETGLQPTAAWVSMMSRGRFSVTTAHRALRGLADKGVLRRLSEPKNGDAGVKYEFVVDPGDKYPGPLSVMTYATEIEKSAPQGVSFSTKVNLSGHPSNGKAVTPVRSPSAELKMDDPDDDESEFDTSVFTTTSEPEFAVQQDNASLTGGQQEFAAELEAVAAKNSEPRLRLLRGQCDDIAASAKRALELGWEPRALAVRMASELNPKIHSPQRLLEIKLAQISSPPPKRSRSTLEMQMPRESKPVRQPDEDAVARAEAAKARYQAVLRATRMTGRSKKI